MTPDHDETIGSLKANVSMLQTRQQLLMDKIEHGFESLNARIDVMIERLSADSHLRSKSSEDCRKEIFTEIGNLRLAYAITNMKVVSLIALVSASVRVLVMVGREFLTYTIGR